MKKLLLVLAFLALTKVHGQETNYYNFTTVDQTKEFFDISLKNRTPIISGHRGGIFLNLPENSTVTFDYVLANTPSIFEVDVRLTKDNKVTLLHDETLDRTTTGSGDIKAVTLEEIEAFKLKDPRGHITPFSVPTLEETIIWSKGKTLINLDVKDVPIEMKASLVKKHDAFAHVIFTVHSPQEAQTFYEFDTRSMFSAFIKTIEDFKAYDSSDVPWENILIAYVGPHSKKENKELYNLLHDKGVSVMVSAASSYDKLEDPKERAKAYRKIITDGADVLESDRPLEVAKALESLKN